MSKDRRFKLVESSAGSSGDHFYPDPEMEWRLIDTSTKRTVLRFEGRWDGPDTIQSVKFSRNGKEVIAKAAKGKIMERVDLIKLAEQLDRNK